MKKIKITLNLIILLIIFLPFFPANAGCGWRTKVTTSAPGINVASSDCATGDTSSADNKCSEKKPSPGLNSYSICCCGPSYPDTAATVQKKETLFSMPDFQVDIPGMQKMASFTCATGDECKIPWIGQYIKGLYDYALSIAGILAALVLMAGGVIWLISAGDASKITQAKELITGSITGLIILTASYVILLQINPSLVLFNPIGISQVIRMDYGDSNWTGAQSTKQSPPQYCGCVNWKNLYASSNLKSAAAIKTKLAGTPLADYSDLIAKLSASNNIDPALVLSIWQQDSSYATAGAGKTNKNPGNVTCGKSKGDVGWSCSTDGKFRVYDNFTAAITDWFAVVNRPGGRLQSKTYVRDLIKSYAPPEDKNDTQGYVNMVMSNLNGAHNNSLKATDGDQGSLQKCSDIKSGC